MRGIATDPRAALFALLHPIFRDCVDTDATKYDLSTPFVQGDHVYATDSRIGVRCPATAERVAAIRATPGHPSQAGRRERKRPPIDAMFREFRPFDLATPYPAPDTSSLKCCPACNGVDRLPVTYEDWYLFDEDGHCAACYGTHIDHPFEHKFSVGPARFAAAYSQILDRHKATLFLPFDRPEEGPAFFTIAPDVEGCLMPLKPDPRFKREGA